MQKSIIPRFLFIVLFSGLMVCDGHTQDNVHISISGTLLMLDNQTPHVAVVVQVVKHFPDDDDQPTVVATVLSDKRGRYEFTSLSPGKYRVRCYTTNGYVYYKAGNPGSRDEVSRIPNASDFGHILNVEPGKTLSNIDFRIAPFKKGMWKDLNHLNGLAANDVWALYADADGRIWVGTRGGGVSRFDGKEVVTFTQKDGLAHNWVRAIHGEPDGVMWFGTEGGLSRYDGEVSHATMGKPSKPLPQKTD
ncbi:hypothetical protein HYR99_14440 [Candidatus Poribacteria bacterium]|nr:hypothetical protein [Candidatus Poribacteria bacterium]